MASNLMQSFPYIVRSQELGIGAVCDTVEQAQEFVEHYDGTEDAESAAKIVNRLYEDDTACLLAMFSFIRSHVVKAIPCNGGEVDIVLCTITGILTDSGWKEVQHAPQYIICKRSWVSLN